MNMRRYILIVFSTLVLAGCCSVEKDIKDVAYSYLDAMGNYKVAEAYPYASKATCEKTLEVMEKYLLPKTDTNYIKSNTPATIEILKVEVLSDSTAIVDYKKTTPIQVQNGKLDMVKEEGKWCAEVIMALPSIMQLAINPDSTAVKDKLKDLKGKVVAAQKSELNK
jgi:hypothetical protein